MKLNRLLWAALAAFFISCGPAHADFEFSDIACETTTTSGTGTVNLAGALTGGYLGFLAAGIDSGDTVPYHIKDGSQLETGIGTFTDGAPDTLSRTADWSTDGAGAELTLSGGTATVCIGPITSIFTGGVAGVSFATVTASGNITSTAGDVTSGDDVIVGDDIAIATGGVINFDAGDVTLTHSADQLTTAGGQFRVTNSADVMDVRVVSTADTVDGAIINLWHDDPSADVDDFPGEITVSGGADDELVGYMLLQLDDPATTTEDAHWEFYADEAGVDTLQASVGQGVIIGSGTTFPGAGDLAVGDDITLSSSSPQINFTDTDTGADSFWTANSSTGAIQISADSGNEVASSRIILSVDGANQWNINANGLYPETDASEDIGTTTQSVNNLFFDTGAVINFENGDVTVTHSTNTLSFTGATSGYLFDGVGPVVAGYSDAAVGAGNLAIDDNGVLLFYEAEANGDNFKAFSSNTTATADTTCTFENDANFIPDSCVGDGSDASDGRLKENLKPAGDVGPLLDGIKIYNYNWTADAPEQSEDIRKGKPGFGPVAQELFSLNADWVDVGGEDPLTDPWTWKPEKLVPYLIVETQNLRKRVAALEAAAPKCYGLSLPIGCLGLSVH
jgi:hypothetical protein